MAKNIAFVFPGQGAQYSGMGKDFYNQYEKAKQIYDYASEICNIDVKKICFDSSDSRIHETKYTQIAIFTTSLAILECVYGMGVTSNVNAGLSLGEYTALAASNVIDIKDLFLLVKKTNLYGEDSSLSAKDTGDRSKNFKRGGEKTKGEIRGTATFCKI